MVIVNGGSQVNLINVLVVAVACLTMLSALALLFGGHKSKRKWSLWFLAAAIGEVVWGVSIAGFLSLGTGEVDYLIAPWLIKGIYVGALFMDAAMLGYVSWRYKFGKILTSVFLMAATVLTVIFLYDPAVHFSSFTLSSAGNAVHYDVGAWFIAYIIYFCTVVPAFCLALVYRIYKATNKNMKKALGFFMVGLLIAGGASLVFDLILPIWRFDLVWVGPLLIGLVILGFYYAVLRYRMISLQAKWLKMMSAVVLANSVVIIYLLIFHMIFSALFRVDSPSYQVILLNFIMVAVVLLLAPAISETWSMIKSLIMSKQIDIAYIVTKLSRIKTRNLNLKDVSGFLAEHMHYAYVGFLIKGRLYVSDDCKFAAEDLLKIPKIKVPAKGIWQNLADLNSKIVRENGIYKIAILSGANGDIIGQVILGRPTTKTTLDRKDIVETEMIISLIGTMIGNGRRKS